MRSVPQSNVTIVRSTDLEGPVCPLQRTWTCLPSAQPQQRVEGPCGHGPGGRFPSLRGPGRKTRLERRPPGLNGLLGSRDLQQPQEQARLSQAHGAVKGPAQGVRGPRVLGEAGQQGRGVFRDGFTGLSKERVYSTQLRKRVQGQRFLVWKVRQAKVRLCPTQCPTHICNICKDPRTTLVTSHRPTLAVTERDAKACKSPAARSGRPAAQTRHRSSSRLPEPGPSGALTLGPKNGFTEETWDSGYRRACQTCRLRTKNNEDCRMENEARGAAFSLQAPAE